MGLSIMQPVKHASPPTAPPSNSVNNPASLARTTEPESEQTTTWAFYFMMAMLALGLVFMIGMLLFSL